MVVKRHSVRYRNRIQKVCRFVLFGKKLIYGIQEFNRKFIEPVYFDRTIENIGSFALKNSGILLIFYIVSVKTRILPSLDSVVSIAAFFKTSADYLLGIVDY